MISADERPAVLVQPNPGPHSPVLLTGTERKPTVGVELASHIPESAMRARALLRIIGSAGTAVFFAHCASSGHTASNADPTTNINTRVLAAGQGMLVETTDVNGGDVVRLKGTPSDAMTTLAQVYADLQIPIGTMVPEAGQIGNQNLRIHTHRLNGKLLSDYVNCGQESMVGPRADIDEVTLSVMSTVGTGKDGNTFVETMLGGKARPSGTSSNPVDCQSTGLLEHTIAQRLTKALGAPEAGAS